MAERRCLVTGGTGYVGARLAVELARDFDVTVTQRTASPARTAWLTKAGLQSVPYDSARQARLEVRGDFDCVINMAMPGAAEAAREPAIAGASARSAAAACLALLDEGRAGRLLHFSSFHVYGGETRAVYREDDAVAPVHPYGQAHLACETLVLSRPGSLVVRPSNIVAAPAHCELGDQARLLALDLCRQAAAGAIRLHNDGLSFRDFIPFGDVAAAVRLLLGLAPLPDARVFNLARGEAQRLDELAGFIRKAARLDGPVAFGAGQDAFRQPFTIDVGRLRAAGWEPAARLEDELARTVAFFS